MTALLQQAFAEAAKLSDPEQDLLASRLMAELAAENDFDRAISASSERLAKLATAALFEESLAIDWSRPEEDAAWSYLYPTK